MSQDFVWTDALVAEYSLTNQKMTQSEFKRFVQEREEKTKRDWEIVAFLDGVKVPNGNGAIVRPERHHVDYWLRNNYPIYSVKRISDGEVFFIGDELERWGVIESFFIQSNKWLLAECGENSVFLNEFKKVVKPKPLFVTEDGKELFLGDTAFIVIKDERVHEQVLNTSDEGMWKGAKMFSTEVAAEEYILMNKPCLSLNDIKWWIEKYFDIGKGGISIEMIKPLAKEKLSK